MKGGTICFGVASCLCAWGRLWCLSAKPRNALARGGGVDFGVPLFLFSRKRNLLAATILQEGTQKITVSS